MLDQSTPRTRHAVQTDGLVIGYAGKAISGSISLGLQANEVLCLLGPNGSGKTTLFKTLMGLIPPLAGQLLINDKPAAEWPRRALAGYIGWVPQAHDSVFPFTVAEIVLMGRTARMGRFAGPGKADRQIADQCLQLLNIAHLHDKPYTKISGGEKQLTLIARAMAQEPAVLIMDEPTASLDFGNQIRVLEHIRQLKRRGISVLLSTHQPEHAWQVADRVALFRDGTVHGCGEPRQTMQRDRLAWLYDLDPSQVPVMAAHGPV